uniref:SRCR domain-containing protein n=1 Tax=Myripristis murdjan TaxID=586833 RepID=A0A668AIX5_9TELE
GGSRCAGRVEVKSDQSWSSVCEADFDQQDAEVVCRELGCGPPSVLQGALYGEAEAPMWTKEFQCEGSESSLLDCRSSGSARNTCSPGKAVGLTCSEPDDIRLVGGASRCNGRVEVKSDQSWSSVCEADFDQHDAEVVCRELGCGPPSVLQGALYGEVETPVWTKEFQCEGSESSLLDCGSSGSARNTCSPGKAVGLTCSGTLLLVGGDTPCSGILEVKYHGEWKPVYDFFNDWGLNAAAVACRELDCGSAASITTTWHHSRRPVWRITPSCPQSGSTLRECIELWHYNEESDGRDTESRLVGHNRCSGTLEMKQHGEWKPVDDQDSDWNLKAAAAVCRELDCGSAVSTERSEYYSRSVWLIRSSCLRSGSTLKECVETWSEVSSYNLEISCSGNKSVRLVNGNSLCSGRVEVKSDQSWSSVCEADFDQQDAEVVCRELGCGAPSVLQGALYGEGEAPMWTKEFQCEGNESSLLDCGSSGSARNTCSPGKAVGLTCSEPDVVRVVGGASRCSGRLELKQHGEWKLLVDRYLKQKVAAAACRELDCGSAVSAEIIQGSPNEPEKSAWDIRSTCLRPGSTLTECVKSVPVLSTRSLLSLSLLSLSLSLSLLPESVRLVNGNSLCSGRVEVKSDQSWSSVCEADFDQQDAQVLCRELGCGPPSVLQGALYGEAEAPMWTKEFQCEGSESSLLDCGSSGSARNTCSPGKAVGLTCSELDIRLGGGASRCAGRLELKHLGEWKLVGESVSELNLKAAAAVCRELDCGSVVSAVNRHHSSYSTEWMFNSSCFQSGYTVRECVSLGFPVYYLEITCSQSVRLVNGNSVCSGRVEVKSDQSWSSVCEADFDQQDAEVVCRELGCGPPSLLQGALYGEAEAPMGTKEFQCEGSESSLLDCGSSGSARNTCSPGKAVGLTCSGRRGAAAPI